MVNEVENEDKIIKKCKTIFPIGFGVSGTDDNIVIMNFIDVINPEENEYEVISSIAMSKNKAKLLMESLRKAIEDEDNDSN